MTTETLTTGFDYPDGCTRDLCEREAEEIRDLNYARVKFDVAIRVEIGKRLNRVASTLPHGRFGPWLAHHFPDWSDTAIRRWRTMAHRLSVEKGYDDSRQLCEILHKFESTTAAEDFLTLPEPARDRVVETGAWTWGRYQAVKWDHAMRERLADEELDHGRRHGDVLHAIEDALHDESAPGPLREAAEALYEENRDAFARLADREPAEMDVETGVGRKEPSGNGDRPSAQLVERDEGYWLCRRLTVNGRDEYVPVAPVRSHVLMWNGSAEPSVLAAFPVPSDGPGMASWQRAGVGAFAREVRASTLDRFREVL